MSARIHAEGIFPTLTRGTRGAASTARQLLGGNVVSSFGIDCPVLHPHSSQDFVLIVQSEAESHTAGPSVVISLQEIAPYTAQPEASEQYGAELNEMFLWNRRCLVRTNVLRSFDTTSLPRHGRTFAQTHRPAFDTEEVEPRLPAMREEGGYVGRIKSSTKLKLHKDLFGW